MTAGENRHYQTMIAQLPFGYAYHRIITNTSGEAVDYTFLAVNAAFEQLIGLKAKDIIHKNASELFPNIRIMDFDWIKTFGEVAATGKPAAFEQFFEPLNCWYSVYATSPKKGYFSVLVRDITSEKAHEKNLKDSEEIFAVAFQKAPFAMALTDVDTGLIVEVNDAFLKLLGYGRDELIGEQTAKLGLWDDPSERDAVLNELKAGRSVIEREILIRNKSGALLHGLFSASIVHINNKPFILSTNEDITKRKLAETALKESEQKFSTAFQLAPYAITLTDGETEKIVEVNEAFITSTGYTREEIIGKRSSELALWVSNEERQSVIGDLRNGIPVRGREYRFRNKDGSLVYGSFSATVVSIRNKPYVLGSIEDITEKKRLTGSLEKEQAFRKYLFENAKDGYVLLSLEHRVIDANKQLCRMLGYTIDELKQMHVWDYHTGMSRADMQNLYNAEELVADIFETRFVNKDGVAFHVEVNAWAFDWRGEKIIFCACRDITARKYMEVRRGQTKT